MNASWPTALKASLISCHSCHLLCKAPPLEDGCTLCPRCGAKIHARKPNSIARTWALVIAAFIFYIPANVLPITRVISFGKAQSDTIMSGVIYFVKTGGWPIALVIFVASIFADIFFDFGADEIKMAPKGPNTPLPHYRSGGSLVDGRYLRGDDFGGSGQAGFAGNHRGRPGGYFFCRSGDHHHFCRHEF